MSTAEPVVFTSIQHSAGKTNLALAIICLSLSQAGFAQTVLAPSTSEDPVVNSEEVSPLISTKPTGKARLTTPRSQGTNSVEMITGGSSTDGAAKISRLPILD